MKEKNFIIFYFDVDEEGYPYIDVERLQQIFNTLKSIAKPEERFILLPKWISHSNWMIKEEYLNFLKDEIKMIEGNTNE